MTCPICGGKTKIYDSRPDEETVKRRRECLECGYRFPTMEIDADMFERTKRIPENCTTCQFGRMYGCAHADRQKDWTRYVSFTWSDNECPSFNLDRNRYKAAKQ